MGGVRGEMQQKRDGKVMEGEEEKSQERGGENKEDGKDRVRICPKKGWRKK